MNTNIEELIKYFRGAARQASDQAMPTSHATKTHFLMGQAFAYLECALKLRELNKDESKLIPPGSSEAGI